MKPNRPQLQKVPSPAALASLVQAFNHRRYAEMEQLALVLTRDYPQLALGWKALGIALKQMGRAADALLPMQTAIELNLSDSEAHNNLGNVMKTLGRFAEAESCYRQAIALKPDYVEAYGNLGVTLQGLGRLDEAEACYRQAIALKPDYVEAHNNLGVTLKNLRRFAEAENCYRQAIALKPEHVEAHSNLGVTLQGLGRLDEAEACYRRAIVLQPDYVEAHINLGVLLKELGRLDEAEACYRQAIIHNPGDADAHIYLTELLNRTNRTDQLREHLADIPAEVRNTSPDIALAHAQLLRGDNQMEAARNVLLAHEWENRPNQEIAVVALTLLGEVQERLGDYDQSFTTFEHANAIAARRFSRQGIGRQAYMAQIEQQRMLFSTDWIGGWTQVKLESVAPVFLVGFPRSGTTLLDTVLRSHPDISVIEERPTLAPLLQALGKMEQGRGDVLGKLDADSAGELRKLYLCARARFDESQGRRRLLIDKLPLNLVHAGLIQRLFPDARFILALRHPCDCVLSGFMHNFEPNSAMASFLSLDHAAKLYDQSMGLWEHYRALLPLDVHAVRYENMVEDFEATVAGLLNFLGVAWDDAVTRYHETAKARKIIRTPSYNQVTQPIYKRASGRWENFREYMQPVLPTLLPWAEHYGYGEARQGK